MRVLLLGYGSIGQRHAANLRALRPDADIVISDPAMGYTRTGDMDCDCAIIATPHNDESHAAYMNALDCPFYVEKPMLRPCDIGGFVSAIMPRVIARPCAVGFQYRFSPSIALICGRLHLGSRLSFTARDSLVSRYGSDVAGIMGAHAFDLACWLLGNPVGVRLKSDGVKLTGAIEHERGVSSYDMDMDAGARVSECVVDGYPVALTCGNDVYLAALGAWLSWVEGGARDPRTATLAAGLSVAHVMEQVMYV